MKIFCKLIKDSFFRFTKSYRDDMLYFYKIRLFHYLKIQKWKSSKIKEFNILITLNAIFVLIHLFKTDLL